MKILNDSTKIGIAKLLSLIGVEENYKEVVELNGFNENYCSRVGCDTCRLIHLLKDEYLKNDLINNYCVRNCPNVNRKVAIYKNKKNYYKIKNIFAAFKIKITAIFILSLCLR